MVWVILLAVELPGTQPETLAQPLRAPRVCHDCHRGYAEYSAGDTWAGSMMANAARDPLFRAALTIANQDVPGVGDLCIRCHSPQGWLGGRSDPPDGSALVEADLESVTCDFCHRLVEGDGPLIGNGQYFVADDQVRRGPIDDPRSRHESAHSDYTSSSELCGICHDVSNPLNGGFPIERTYTEWKRSAFPDEGRTCQSCHLPAEEGAFAAGVRNLPERTVHRHDLAGGNTWMPTVLATLYPERAEAYAYTAARAQAMLESAATLEIAAEATRAGAVLAFDVRVENRAGHKLPTGYPEGRRCWLEVVVMDADGHPLMHSGAYDEQTATRATDPQLRTYEVRLGAGGEEGFHFVLQDTRIQDDRIPPRGFRADPDTVPVGREYPTQADGTLAHWDVAPYRVTLPEDVTGPLRVVARLRYQTTSRDYVTFLRDENRTDDRGAELYELWERHGRAAPVVMASAEVSVDVAPMPDAAPVEPVADAGPTGAEPRDAQANDAVDDPAPEQRPAPESRSTDGCSSTGGSWGPAGLVLLAGAIRRQRRRR